MSQSVLDRTGFRDTNIAEQTRRSAACAVGMGGCAQGREVRRYYRGAGDTVQSASSRGSSSPGVARTKTAQARLLSALVRCCRQACGRTAPSSSAMCSSVRDSNQFRSDTNYELRLIWYQKRNMALERATVGIGVGWDPGLETRALFRKVIRTHVRLLI